MGSSSNSCDLSEYGGRSFQSPNGSCPEKVQKINNIKWLSIENMPRSASIAINIDRILVYCIPVVNVISAGVTRGQDTNHEAIKAEIECTECKAIDYYILEYTKISKQYFLGNYSNYTTIEEYNPSNMYFINLINIYNENSSDWTKEKNSLWYHKCKDFAYEKFYKIKSNY